ncbi:copper chaperone PCu(A)C [Cupriavidus basilensis]|uniref:Copper chaperone PCu(A)C n=1 Tax=Cupriavidus basilensis TaxID=68895 RepID=A0ABT6ARI2_9BURK|nr:copper chaperone PCu(A)C [Cupriavidus basilensis]MDF3835203.1 copper chaperone PCu(A)C [Cupriavidus basilensis]
MQARFLAAVPAALFAALCSTAALAQVDVSNAWARGTVPAQTATGVFMTLHAHTPAKLVGVSTPAAATAEVHEMKMDGNVMRMRALGALDLPAMQDVELKPGGYHVMLMGLKAPLKKGDKVALTLKFEQGGKMVEQKVDAEVRDLGAAAPAAVAHGDHKH